MCPLSFSPKQVFDMRIYYYGVSEWTYRHTPGKEKSLALWTKRIAPDGKYALPLSLTLLCAEDQTEESKSPDTVELVSDLEEYGIADLHEGLMTIPTKDFAELKESLLEASRTDHLHVVITLSTEAANLNAADILEFSFELAWTVTGKGTG